MKNIVFCADGIWGGPGQSDTRAAPPTNVLRLFASLEGRDDPLGLMLAREQERAAPEQVAKYLDGTGDAGNALARALGGTPGAGFIARIVRGYTFISRSYQPGDRIFLAGFSQGAHTVRALAGLIAARGLLDAAVDDRDTAYRLAAAVWHDWRREMAATTYWRRALEALGLDLPGFVSAPPTNRLCHAPIEAVAVWETVGTRGIPDHVGMGSREDIFRFDDIVLHPSVAQGFHALAIDERRADFAPTYWQPDPRVIQCLFPGCHEDVGGGTPMTNNESGLADGCFAWMKDNLAAVGVRFAAEPPFPIAPDPYASAHQPWTEFPFSSRAQGPRELNPGLQLSQSARDRRAGGPVMPAPHLGPRPYRPINLSEYP